MTDNKFRKIRISVLELYNNYASSNLPLYRCLTISKNEETELIIDMTFNHCLAQLVVCEPGCAAFRNVFFEAGTIESKKAMADGGGELIYFFYDSLEFSVNEIIEEVNTAIQYCSEYKPDVLGKRYINLKGRINFNNEKVSHVVHVSDLEKITDELLRGEFVCIDTQFQYLVLKNAKSLVKVLPRVFVIK